jgi:hypothetical protein
MGEKEHEMMQGRLRELTPDQRRFRINAGRGWVAAPRDTLHPPRPMTVRVMPGDVVLHRARPFIGAPEGWSDLVGIDSIVIRPEDVPPEGLRVALFVAEEFKTPGVRLTEEQRLFGKMVLGLGGRFSVVRAP